MLVFDPMKALEVITKRRTAFEARKKLPDLAKEPVLRLLGITEAEAQQIRKKTKEG